LAFLLRPVDGQRRCRSGSTTTNGFSGSGERFSTDLPWAAGKSIEVRFAAAEPRQLHGHLPRPLRRVKARRTRSSPPTASPPRLAWLRSHSPPEPCQVRSMPALPVPVQVLHTDRMRFAYRQNVTGASITASRSPGSPAATLNQRLPVQVKAGNLLRSRRHSSSSRAHPSLYSPGAGGVKAGPLQRTE